jgi:hypothetical protein
MVEVSVFTRDKFIDLDINPPQIEKRFYLTADVPNRSNPSDAFFSSRHARDVFEMKQHEHTFQMRECRSCTTPEAMVEELTTKGYACVPMDPAGSQFMMGLLKIVTSTTQAMDKANGHDACFPGPGADGKWSWAQRFLTRWNTFTTGEVTGLVHFDSIMEGDDQPYTKEFFAGKFGPGKELPLFKDDRSASMRIWTAVGNKKRLFVTPVGKSAVLNTFDTPTPEMGGKDTLVEGSAMSSYSSYSTVKDFIQKAAADSRLTPKEHFVLFFNQWVEHAGVIAPKAEWCPETRFPPSVVFPGATSMATSINNDEPWHALGLDLQGAIFAELKREVKARKGEGLAQAEGAAKYNTKSRSRSPRRNR